MKSAIAALLALGLTGCFVPPIGPKDKLTDSGPADAGPVDSGTGVDANGGCTTNADCPEGVACFDGMCINEGPPPDAGSDSGPMCVVDSDCPPNELCIANGCVLGADGGGDVDEDAGPGDAGMCVNDSDCSECGICFQGQCMSTGCPDASGIDSGPVDSGPPPDAGRHRDAGPEDAGPVDAGPVDAGPVDAGPVDAGPVDAGPMDAGPMDAGRPMCGNGIVEAGEQCDLGNLNGTGVGCNSMCQFDCQVDSDCSSSTGSNQCVSAPACATSTLDNETVKNCVAGTDLPACTACGTSFCNGHGQCKPNTCGDGCLDTAAGEQCDFGAGANVSGSGCDPDCKFSCTESPDSCVSSSPCSGATCSSITGPNGDMGQACGAGTPPANGTMCGNGDVCIDMLCVAPTCGDGVVDQSTEQCDLGAQNGQGLGCNSMCQFDCESNSDCAPATACMSAETCTAETFNGETVKECLLGSSVAACSPCIGMPGLCNAAGTCNPSTCGDGCIDTTLGEQCDDGNLFDLDGCNSTCQYEVVGRMTTVSISGSRAPSFCTPDTNAFGTQVLSNAVLGQINPPLQSDVTDGLTNITTQLLGLTDLTGTTAQSGLQMGVLTGELDPRKGAWPNNSPIDWWFLADQTSVSSGLPVSLMPASISSQGVLTAGPADVSVQLNLAGVNALLEMRSAQINAAIDASPAADVPAPPPAKLAPGLTVFQDVTADGNGQGLCGNITVESLAQIPVPQALASGGQYACGASCFGSPKTYTYCGANQPVGPNCNSMLDLIIGGCQVEFCIVTAVNPTQPDVPANGHSVTHLSLGAGNKVPASQSNGDLDGYSSYLQFDANRGHFTGQTCTIDSDCQTGQTCNGTTCG